MKMKKQGKSVGHSRPNNGIKISPGPNKNNLKNQKAKKSPLKFLSDLKKAEDAKPLVKKFIGQGKVMKNPGKSLKKNKNKNKNRNQSKKGMAPPVNPDSIDKAVIEKSADEEMIEESADEEMNEVNSSEGLESPTSLPKKNKNKKKKLGLLAAKKGNKENKENGGDGDNKEDEKDNENSTPNAEKEGKDKAPKKFCLFVGNLPYDVKEEQVREHFKSLKNGLTAVRLMTHENTGKGRGFAFIELLNSGAYKAAIKLHKRKMGERIIRVEYTTPGKSENVARKKFMHKKTKKLLGQKKHSKGKGFNKKKGKGKK